MEAKNEGGERSLLGSWFTVGWPASSLSLHRYWPLFDHFVRQALRNSSLSIHLPAAVSAFDLYPLAEDGTLRPFNGRYLHSYLKALPVGFSVLPQVRWNPEAPVPPF